MSGDIFEIRLISSKNCFLHMPEKWLRKMQESKNTKTTFVRMLYGNDSTAYLSCMPLPVKDIDKNVACLNASFARTLNVTDGDEVVVSFLEKIPSVSSVRITPISNDDFEILVESTSAVENSLLDQVKVVWTGQVLPIWISKTFCLEVQVDGLQPNLNVGCLEQFTELVVSSPTSSKNGIPSHRADNSSKTLAPRREIETEVFSADQLISSLPKPIPLPENKPFSENLINKFFPSEKKNKSSVLKSNKLGRTNVKSVFNSTCHINKEEIPLSFRVHPLDDVDAALFLPCHVALHDKVFKQITTSICTSPVVCTISRLVPPKVLVEYKSEEGSKVHVEENAQIQKDRLTFEENSRTIYAQLISTNDLDEKFVTSKFKQMKMDSVMVSNNIRRQLSLEIGARVTLSFNLDNLLIKNVKTIEIIPLVKDTKDIEYAVNSSFKNLVHHSMHGLVLTSNSQLIIPKAASSGMSQEIIVNITVNHAEEGFAIINSEQLEAYNITVHSGKNLENNIKTLDQLDPAFSEDKSIPLQFAQNIVFEALYSNSLTLNLHSTRSSQQEKTIRVKDNVLVLGKPGSGKTSLVKTLCSHLQKAPNFVWTKKIDCKPLKGKKTDVIIKILKQAFDDAVYHQPSIIIFDDIESIAGVEADRDQHIMVDSTFKRVGRVIREMSESLQTMHDIAVAATAVSASQVSQELISARGNHLFKTVLEIPELTRQDRRELLEKAIYCIDGAAIAKEVNLDILASKTEGYTCQDLMDFIDKAVFVSWKRGGDETSFIDDDVFAEALTMSTPMALRGVDLQQEIRQGWKDVGGLTSVKEELVEILQWPSMYPELFEQCPLRLQSGVLLYGAPGTGKTLLAGAVAHECGINFISIKGPELLSKYIGASEESVRKVFEKAMSAKPCVLFFDEFDSLAPRRGHDSTGVTDRVVNQLLTQLDGVEGLNGVWVLAATSRPDLLDPALLRPGRLDRIIHCPLPNESDRLSILRALSQHMKLNPDVDFGELAKETSGFTGADLQAVLYTAQLAALEEREKELQSPENSIGNDGDTDDVTKTVFKETSIILEIANRHIQQSLSSTRPSLPPTECERYRKIYDRFAATRGIPTADMLKNQQRATLA